MSYPGGKGRLFQRIVSLMPPHRTYIETHLGQGAVLRRKRPAQVSFGIDKDPAVVARWGTVNLPGCTVVQGDAVDFLTSFPFSGGELVYCDPPYLPRTRRQRRVYRFDYGDADHAALLQVLVALPCAVMLSGYPSELYERALTGWRRVGFASPTQSGNRSEVLWMNFEAPPILHDHSYLGADFRVREQIRRRRARLMRRIQQLCPEERHALLAEVVEIDRPVLARLFEGAASVPQVTTLRAPGAARVGVDIADTAEAPCPARVGVIPPDPSEPPRPVPPVSALPVSMLEAGTLPVAALARLAVREGRRPRPVYGSHKWFARRLGSTFRALLVAAATEEGGDFWRGFEQGVDLGGKVVLDPFVGGGTSIIEGQRLGATCIGTDVDPVAVAVTRFQSRLQVLPDLDDALSSLRTAVAERLAPFYSRQDGRVVLHHFWVQTVPCQRCGTTYDAHPNYRLAAETGSKSEFAFCRHCGEVHEMRAGKERFRCRSCRRYTCVEQGTVRNGTAACPRCRREQRLIELGASGKPPSFRLFALEVLPEAGARASSRPVPMAERAFIKAEPEDLERYDAAERELARLLADGGPGLPGRAIPAEGRSDNRLIQYGYRRYTNLFNARQLLHLLLLSRAILAMPEGPAREAASIAFSDHLKSNCMLTSYAAGYRRLSPLFALRAFRHVPRPVEANPWVEGTGRGSFPNAVRSVSRAAKWAAAPTEYRLEGGFHPARPEPWGPADIRLCSARDLAHVLDGSVDLVLTDPPYFDNIAYSELADFFLPWQRHLGLVGGEPGQGLPEEQLAAARRTDEAARAFGDRLGECFQTIARKMKPGALGAFTYQHSTELGWQTLAGALAKAELEVVTVFPMPGDTGANLHREADSICWDAVLVLRKPRSSNSEAGAPQRTDIRSRSPTFAPESVAAFWSERLAAVEGVPYRMPDRVNLFRAASAAARLQGGQLAVDT